VSLKALSRGPWFLAGTGKRGLFAAEKRPKRGEKKRRAAKQFLKRLVEREGNTCGPLGERRGIGRRP